MCSGSVAPGKRTVFKGKRGSSTITVRGSTFEVRRPWYQRSASHPSGPERRASNVERLSRQRDAQDGLELVDGAASLVDLDRGHAEGAGALEVDAEVVEEDGLFGGDAELLAGHQVDARVRFAQAHLRRLDHHVEEVEDVAARARAALADDVVGDAAELVAAVEVADDGVHLRALGQGGERGEEALRVRADALDRALGLELARELLGREGALLEAGVGALGVGDERAEDAVVQAAALRPGADGGDGRGGEHAADVEDDRADVQPNPPSPFPRRDGGALDALR